MIHIGSKIKEVFEASGMTKTFFAKKIYCTRQNVYRIFNRVSVDTALLQRISQALNYDFFQYYITHSEEEGEAPSPEDYSKIALLKKEVAAQKKIYEELKEKNRKLEER